jgi:hypothetical protein
MKSVTTSQAGLLYTNLMSGKTCAETVVADVLANRRRLEAVLQGISDSRPRIKFGCSKSLLILSEKNPGLLYSKINRIIKLLENENQILKWTAIAALGNLASIDQTSRTRDLLPKLFEFLACGELITANHAIATLGKIGRVFRSEQEVIADRLVGVENCSFDTDECKNIALGKVILALGMFVSPVNASRTVVEFVRRQIDNKRPATAKKARAFMKRLSLNG